MFYDRGTIKWNSLMLPEHVKKLREWEHRVKSPDDEQGPLWDEQAFAVWEWRIRDAWQSGTPVTLTFSASNGKRSVSGRIISCDPDNGTLTLETAAGRQKIPAGQITGLETG